MSRPALLLAGHGTRDPAGVAAFGAFTARIAAALAPQGVDVAGGFIELSAPPLRDAVAELTGRGHRHLVAVPLVLSAASHSKSDIPAALARERARHPGLGWSYGRPLGPHPHAASRQPPRQIRHDVALRPDDEADHPLRHALLAGRDAGAQRTGDGGCRGLDLGHGGG